MRIPVRYVIEGADGSFFGSDDLRDVAGAKMILFLHPPSEEEIALKRKLAPDANFRSAYKMASNAREHTALSIGEQQRQEILARMQQRPASWWTKHQLVLASGYTSVTVARRTRELVESRRVVDRLDEEGYRLIRLPDSSG